MEVALQHLNNCGKWADTYQRIMTNLPSHSGLYKNGESTGKTENKTGMKHDCVNGQACSELFFLQWCVHV